MAEFSDIIRKNRDTTVDVAATFAGFPPLTRHVRAAKRTVSEQYARFVFSLSDGLEKISALRRRIKELRDGQT